MGFDSNGFNKVIGQLGYHLVFLVVFLTLVLVDIQIHAQCPISAQYQLPQDTICQGLSINLAAPANPGNFNYQWDLCYDSLNNLGNSTKILDDTNNYISSFPVDIEPVKGDSIWHAFIASPNNLVRLDFGNGIDQNPTQYQNLGQPGGFSSSRNRLDFIKQDSLWLGFMVVGGQLIRFNFGSKLTNPNPSTTALSVSGSVLSNIRNNRVVPTDSGAAVLIGKTTDAFGVVELKGDLTNPQIESYTHSLNSGQNSFDLTAVRDCDNWYVFSLSRSSNELVRTTLDDSLDGTATQTTITHNGGDLRTLNLLDYGHSKKIYAQFGEVVVFDFQSDWNKTPTQTLIPQSQGLGLNPLQAKGQWYALAVDNGGNGAYRYIIDTTKSCPLSTGFSKDSSLSITLSSAGSFPIQLSVTNNRGLSIYTLDTLTVVPSPNAQFNFSCGTSTIQFNAQSSTPSGSIVKYNWAFGDGTSGSGPAPSHTYTGNGPYNVQLQVTNSFGCSDTVTKSVPLAPPPTAQFAFDSVLCLGDSIQLANLSSVPAPATITQNLWQFGASEADTVINKDSLIWAFSTQDTNAFQAKLRVTTTDGCTDSIVKTVTVPSLDVQLQDSCWGRYVRSAGSVAYPPADSVTQVTWDFDNGNTVDSLLAPPLQAYPTSGLKNVALQIQTAKGCQDTLQKPLRVNIPRFTFNTERVCKLSPTAIHYPKPLDSSLSHTWNYCYKPQDTLLNETLVNSFTSLGGFPVEIEMVFDTSQNRWRGFVQSANKLTRIDWPGATLDSVPTATTAIQANGNAIPGSRNRIRIAKDDSDQWWGYSIYGGTIQRVAFGDSLDNSSPSLQSWQPANLSGVRNGDFVQGPQGWYLFGGPSGASKIWVYPLGSDLANPNTQGYSVSLDDGSPGADQRGGFDVSGVRSCGNWYVFVLSRATNELLRLSFGDSLHQNPAIDAYAYNGDRRVLSLLDYGAEHSAFLSHSNVVNQFDFGERWAGNTVNSSQYQLNQAIVGFTPAIERHKLYGMGLANNGNLYRYRLQSDTACGIQGPRTSTAAQPDSIAYDQSGPKVIMHQLERPGEGNLHHLDTLQVSPTPQAGWTALAPQLCRGQSLAFQDTSSFKGTADSLTSWRWEFGDGSSPQQGSSVSHTYADTGQYAIQLTVEASNGCRDSLTRAERVRPTPSAGFDVQTACATTPVTFVDSAASNGATITQRVWQLGDGTSLFSPPTPIEHTYPPGGPYEASYRVVNGFGCSDTARQTVPKPSLAIEASELCLETPVTFSEGADYPGDPVTSYSWRFGNGENAAQPNPAPVQFSTSGTYTVELAVTSQSGCQDTVRQDFYIGPKPTVAIGTLGGTCLGPTPIQFRDQTNLPDTTLAKWQWHFGDTAQGAADTAFVANPAYAYNGPGQYNVSLQVETAGGCIAADSQAIQVVPPPQAAIALDSAYCARRTIRPSSQSQTAAADSVTAYRWLYPQFGGQAFSTLEQPSFRYDTAGAYPLTLQITTALGCRDTAQGLLQVRPRPKAQFSLEPSDTGQSPVTIQLQSQTTGADSLLWLREAEAIGQGDTAAPTISDSGRVAFRLIARNQEGCQDTATQSLFVKPPIVPRLDVAVERLAFSLDRKGQLTLLPRVQNNSNVPVTRLAFDVRVGELVVTDTQSVNLRPGETQVLQFAPEVRVNTNNTPRFACLTAVRPNGERDEDTTDNRACRSLTDQLGFISVFPNPAQDTLRVEYAKLAPEHPVYADILDETGRRVMTIDEPANADERFLTSYRLNINRLSTGFYTLRLKYQGEVYMYKFLKQ